MCLAYFDVSYCCWKDLSRVQIALYRCPTGHATSGSSDTFSMWLRNFSCALSKLFIPSNKILHAIYAIWNLKMCGPWKAIQTSWSCHWFCWTWKINADTSKNQLFYCCWLISSTNIVGNVFFFPSLIFCLYNNICASDFSSCSF